MLEPGPEGREVTALLTGNRDPLWLREAGSIRAVINTASDQHILTELEFDVRPGAVGEEILGLLHERLGGVPSPERLVRDVNVMFEGARQAIAELEREMGVTVPTGSRA